MALAFVPRPIAALPWRVLWVVLAIATCGVLGLYSVSPGGDGGLMPYALPHIMRFGVFFAMAIGMSYVKPDTYKELIFLPYIGVILLLFLVMVIGEVGGGARSWLNLGLIRIQPSELMKPVLVLVLARFYAGVPPREIRRWSAIWPALLLVGFPTLIILAPARSRHRHADHLRDDRDDVPRRAAALAVHRRDDRGRRGDADHLLLPACRISRSGC